MIVLSQSTATRASHWDMILTSQSHNLRTLTPQFGVWESLFLNPPPTLTSTFFSSLSLSFSFSFSLPLFLSPSLSLSLSFSLPLPLSLSLSLSLFLSPSPSLSLSPFGAPDPLVLSFSAYCYRSQMRARIPPHPTPLPFSLFSSSSPPLVCFFHSLRATQVTEMERKSERKKEKDLVSLKTPNNP